MAQVQHALMLQITGALRSTPTDLLNLSADLLPFRLLVKKLCHRAFMHLATLPEQHPLHAPVNSKANLHIVRHRSPLHHLNAVFPTTAAQIEKIDYLSTDPATTPTIPVRTDPSKEDAIWTYLLKPAPPAQIYTDGSGYGNVIGAAAILCRKGYPNIALQYCLGPDTTHTVYKGELIGIILALHHIARTPYVSSFAIYTDNQAALLALNADGTHPGNHLIPYIRQRLSAITDPTKPRHKKITFQ